MGMRHSRIIVTAILASFFFVCGFASAQKRPLRKLSDEEAKLADQIHVAYEAKNDDEIIRLCSQRYELIPKGKPIAMDGAARSIFTMAQSLIRTGKLAELKSWVSRLESDYGNCSDFREQVAPTVRGYRNYVGQPKVGQEMPGLTVVPISGKKFELSALRGKVVLIDFWASWCRPSVEELPHLQAAYAKHKNQGFEIISISCDDTERELQDFVRTNRIRWTQHFDGSPHTGELFTKFGILEFPATFLVGKEGKVVATNLRGPMLEEKLAELLK
jgi:peroxiredoxin